MARPPRLERGTLCLEGRCSIQLSYGRIKFYTVQMKRKIERGKREKPNSLRQKSQYANLIRYVPSGTYFARFRIKGKLVWRSLKTDKVTIAHTRLPDEIEKERRKAENASAWARGKMTGDDAIRI